MTSTNFKAAVLMVGTLLTVPVIGLAEDQPPVADANKQTVAVVRNGDAKHDDTSSFSSKRMQSTERNDGIDCFYEENKAERECRVMKSGAH
jgi:hypothetical protein